MKKFYSLILFQILTISPVLFSQNSFINDSLDGYIKREMEKWKIPGVAVGIIKDGKILINKGYGYLDTKKSTKVDEHTLFQIASNSKAFTGTSLANLAYQRKLSLDDKVTKWMPGFKLYDSLATKEVMVKDLLCHRIGFETFQSDMLNWGCNLSRKELITNMRNVKPVYSFRSKYGYCNAAFLAAGELIPAVCDTSWDEYLLHHFFIPLRMNRTSTQWVKINSDANAAKPYTLAGGKLVEMPFVNIDNLGPAASINSSVRDLSNWVLMQLDSGRFEGKTIIPFPVIQMTRNPEMITGKPGNKLFPGKHFQAYGLGWYMEDYHGKKIISHDGGSNGFVTTVCIVPEESLGIIVLTNTDANNFYGALRQQIIDASFNAPYRNYSEIYYQNFVQGEKRKQVQLESWKTTAAKKNKPEIELKQFAGKYKNEIYDKMEIRYENEGLNLYLLYHPQLVGKLEYLENNTFLCTYNDVEYGIKKIPFKVENGKVTSVKVSVNDFIDFMEYEFVKVE